MMSAAKRCRKSAELQTQARHGEAGAARDTTPSLCPQTTTGGKGTILASYNPLEQVTETVVRSQVPEGPVIACPSTVPSVTWDGGAKSFYLVLSWSHVLIDLLQLSIMGP